jgi:prevent-host-death family protein
MVLAMTRVNVADAKARLSELIDAALQGEDVVIARRNQPLVRLTVVASGRNVARFGMFRGRIRTAPDFDEPLEDFAAHILVAQALHEGMSVLTRDTAFEAYGVRRVW